MKHDQSDEMTRLLLQDPAPVLPPDLARRTVAKAMGSCRGRAASPRPVVLRGPWMRFMTAAMILFMLGFLAGFLKFTEISPKRQIVTVDVFSFQTIQVSLP